jgi:hypothetical protein
MNKILATVTVIVLLLLLFIFSDKSTDNKGNRQKLKECEEEVGKLEKKLINIRDDDRPFLVRRKEYF